MTKLEDPILAARGRDRVAMLWQAGLSATVQVRVVKEGQHHNLAAWAIRQKEFSRVESSLQSPEGYPAFTQRLLLAISDLPAKLSQTKKLIEIEKRLSSAYVDGT